MGEKGNNWWRSLLLYNKIGTKKMKAKWNCGGLFIIFITRKKKDEKKSYKICAQWVKNGNKRLFWQFDRKKNIDFSPELWRKFWDSCNKVIRGEPILWRWCHSNNYWIERIEDFPLNLWSSIEICQSWASFRKIEGIQCWGKV